MNEVEGTGNRKSNLYVHRRRTVVLLWEYLVTRGGAGEAIRRRGRRWNKCVT
jgi:hypothetical protein